MSRTDYDPIQLAIMANRMEAIVREMTDTIVRTARSSVIGMARDMSCSIVTREGELVAAAEGVPIHIYGATLQAPRADAPPAEPERGRRLPAQRSL